MNYKFKMTKKIFLLLTLSLTLFATLPIFAKDTTDYNDLAANGTEAEFKKAFSRNPRLNTQTFGSNKETFLMLALQYNRELYIIDFLISMECDVAAKAKDKRTPLMYACQYSTDTDVVDRILRTGAFNSVKKSLLKAKDKSGKTPYDYAKLNSVTEIYELLCKYVADPAVEAQKKAQAKAEKEEAKNAKKAGNKTVAKESLEQTSTTDSGTEENPSEAQNEDVLEDNAEEQSGVPQSDDALIEENDVKEESLKESEENKTEEEQISKNAEAASLFAIQQETSKIEKDLNSYSQSYLYDYALSESVPQDNLRLNQQKQFLVPEPNLANANGVTLLMTAAKSGNEWDIKNLLNSGADIQKRDSDGWTALMYAVRYQNSLSVVETLINNGAHIRVRNNYNSTPLLLAAEFSENPDIVDRLLQNRQGSEDEVFKAFILSITGATSTKQAKLAKLQLFLNMDIPLNRLWKGKTPLMYACEYCTETSVLSLLIQNGARLELRDADGNTAFDYAKNNSKLPHDDVYWSLNSLSR